MSSDQTPARRWRLGFDEMPECEFIAPDGWIHSAQSILDTLNDTPMKRIGPHDHLKLQLFGELVEEAWGAFGYLVGSSQRGEEWRDIDVRVMLPLHQWLRLFHPAEVEKRHQHPGWRAHMLAWSTLGQSLTGLPIDFQVEPNNDTPGPRNPIGIWRPTLVGAETQEDGR